MASNKGFKMAKAIFQGSKVSPGENGLIMLNVLFTIDKLNIMVSLPNRTWADIAVLYDNKEVNMSGEYPASINTVIRQAKKLFPNWAV